MKFVVHSLPSVMKYSGFQGASVVVQIQDWLPHPKTIFAEWEELRGSLELWSILCLVNLVIFSDSWDLANALVVWSATHGKLESSD